MADAGSGGRRAPGTLARAWNFRRASDGQGGDPIVVALRGGSGAFVRRSVARRLVTTVDASDAGSPSSGIAGWLERRQARRSAVLVVPDRATGVAIALRWHLDPQRFRLAGGFDLAATKAALNVSGTRPWHSRA